MNVYEIAEKMLVRTFDDEIVILRPNQRLKMLILGETQTTRRRIVLLSDGKVVSVSNMFWPCMKECA